MEVTDVHVTLAENKRMKALATITLDNALVVHDIRVIEGPKSLFIAMPSKRTAKGTFRDVVHPITQDFRDKIEDAVISKFQKLITPIPITDSAQNT